jgi:hypothetical protein
VHSTKAGRHDIAESGGKHNQNQNQIKNRTTFEQTQVIQTDKQFQLHTHRVTRYIQSSLVISNFDKNKLEQGI